MNDVPPNTKDQRFQHRDPNPRECHHALGGGDARRRSNLGRWKWAYAGSVAFVPSPQGLLACNRAGPSDEPMPRGEDT
ncbi:hypothetical protein CSOJ01_01350 [Colletotrichum sojae]|uniref:Uncharacterized protein n=1 Tax=Colletotrichum sojae TaxID=2175907 RepID=A0A8H6JV66_9PEZI|nr:hypothetical protein CSOJ01_01350 [Colletotrichum sojae]